jgi:hypothetical protein
MEEQPMSDETTGWRPIETAPRDGTQIIIPSQFAQMDADIAAYDPSCPSGHYWWSIKLELSIDEPKWWMPIPEVPNE